MQAEPIKGPVLRLKMNPEEIEEIVIVLKLLKDRGHL
jgi:hypothetical protein